ncbi:hypothetical protein AB1Y20_021443 [Prymnesium parvum]|uniref:Uncharacterized protein n=1 Tax=Prymnesium parvum TaxID=97485 RepID=A0AB34JIA0_PRYPA
MLPIPTCYAEPEAPTRARWAWAEGSLTPFRSHAYLFAADVIAPHEVLPPPAPPTCVANASSPPLGMRSAPPLGGLAAGTVELRADGSLQAWTIENSSPAGATKLARLDDAVLGVRAGGASRLLRTHPPHGLAGVDRLHFSGAMPFTRLMPQDAAFAAPLRLALFGRSKWKVGDMAASASPALAFTLVATNPSATESLELGLFFSLPLQLQRGVSRAPGTAEDGGHRHPTATEALPCFDACAANASCAAWHFAPSDGCVIYSDSANVPPARNSAEEGAASGVRGVWRRGRSAECLTLARDGTHAAAGNATLCGGAEVNGEVVAPSVSGGTAASLKALWEDFAPDGVLDGGGESAAPLGALAVQVVVPPASNASVSISLGWYFPHRDWMGSEVVGNQYTNLFSDAEEAAAALADHAAAALDVREWQGFSETLVGADTSVPVWLGDTLLNSLHHTRSAMWLKDGRWRQWESFSCVNVDSVHNDGERHVPYLMLWPEGLPSKMRAWAAGQLPDGMIQEQLACGCMDATPARLDRPCGRVMGDVSAMFVAYAYALWQWTADAPLVASLWPHAKRAAQWQLDRAAEGGGLPLHLVDTYDGLELQRYNISAYSAFFHLLALRAAEALARAPPVNDTAFAARCAAGAAAARQAVQAMLWNGTAGYYRSFSGGHATMADSLYAQVLADSLGLGALTSDAQVASHVARVVRTNASPYGLLVQTGREGFPIDNSIWMMANANVATLMLWRGTPPEEALAVAEVMLRWWRSGLNDLWNVVAVSTGVGEGQDVGCAGYPWANSHYGYYMVAWHLLFALSGQAWDAPAQALRFAPKMAVPFSLPILVPRTAGKLTAELTDGSVRYTLSIVAGSSLTLRSLRVRDSAPDGPWPRHLAPGDSITWQGDVAESTS